MNSNYKKRCIEDVMIELLDCTKTYNGKVDHEQEIIWSYNGQEVMRSVGGKRTHTPVFVELSVTLIKTLFD